MPPSLSSLTKPASVREWSIDYSTRRDKKWMVKLVTVDGKRHTVHFGDPSMEDYTQHRDPMRRQRFHQRFASLIAKNKDNPLSAMYYSANLLW